MHADRNLVVVDKPAGLLSVPAHDGECLVHLLQADLDAQSYGRRNLAVIHRLDRETSGLLVFARDTKTAAHLAKQLAAHRFEREYVAVVKGQLAATAGTWTSKLDGKRAVTHYHVTVTSLRTTTVTVKLETGRRNQIRRHFAEQGHPIVGDTRFSQENAVDEAWPHTRIALHARVLGFTHPVTKQLMRFEVPLPKAFDPYLATEACRE